MYEQTLALRIEKWLCGAQSHGLKYGRWLIPMVMAGLFLWPDSHALVSGVLADAFWQVSVFVFATLLVYEWASSTLFTRSVEQRGRLQVPWAAFLGALPGCGGAIIVVTQYVQGGMSFGSLVAVLTATMGDAAIVLLAARPTDGLIVIAIGISVGMVTGYLVDKMQVGVKVSVSPERQQDQSIQAETHPDTQSDTHSESGFSFNLAEVWRWLWPLALVVSALMALQYDPDVLFGFGEGSIEFIGALACIAVLISWASNRSDISYQAFVAEEDSSSIPGRFHRVASATHFVTTWVVVAFMVFEIAVLVTGLNLGEYAGSWGLWAPALGVAVGLLPGCGPQILMTSLYIQGALPFSALLGNAISNDGDALFPAIALAPKAAILATLYSTPPALLVAYSYALMFE